MKTDRPLKDHSKIENFSMFCLLIILCGVILYSLSLNRKPIQKNKEKPRINQYK